MCLLKKCCILFEIDLGCLLIGVFNLMISVGTSTASIVLLSAVENEHFQSMHNAADHLLGVVHLDVNEKSKELIISIILFVAVLSTVSSIALIVGVRKRLPGFVLANFAFGIFITFFTSLCSLLLLLKSSWWISSILIAASLINIYFLVVVHTFYELLVRGKVYEQTLHRLDFDDNDLLIETETAT